MSDTTQKPKRRISQHNKEAFRNPWVLGWITAIVLVILVNVGFIVTAVVTNPGLVDENYYQKGRDLEAEIVSLRKAYQRLGWKMALQAEHQPVLGLPVRYTFKVVDREGKPVDGEHAVISAYRPSDASADFHQEMQRIAPGLYSAELTFPLKGIWDLTATLHKGKDALHTTHRISVITR